MTGHGSQLEPLLDEISKDSAFTFGRNGAQRYGCALHDQRGESVCTNGLLIRRDKLEERFLLRLQQAVLREEVIDYAVARLRDELEKRYEELNRELGSLKEEIGRAHV